MARRNRKENKDKQPKPINDPRIPRPEGTTLLAQAFQSTHHHQEKIQIKNKINKHIISKYITGGMRLNGLTVSLSELATTLEITPSNLLKELFKPEQHFSKLSDMKDLQQYNSAILGMALNFAMADRAQIQGQTELLLRAQGDDYKAFVSSEVNKSLKNLLDSQKPLMELFRAVNSGPQTVVNILNREGESESKKDTLSVSQAIELLAEHTGSQPNDEGNLRLLNEAYKDEDMPDIRAVDQVEGAGAGTSLTEIKRQQIDIDNTLAQRE